MKIIRHADNYNNINMLGGFKLGSGDCCVYLEVLDVFPGDCVSKVIPN